MINRMIKKTLGILLLAVPAASNAATLTSGYTTGANSKLLIANGGTGSTLFTDTAATGGNVDPTGTGGTTFAVLLPGTWKLINSRQNS